MSWSIFWVLLIAMIVVTAIGYVIKARRGNGTDTDPRDTPWEDENDARRP